MRYREWPPSPVRALTLIEMLAVIVIVSMVTGALGLSLVGNSRSAEVRAAMARWQDLDAQARIAAQIEGSVRLRLDEDGRGVTLEVNRTAEALGTFRCPEGFVILISSRKQVVESITIDARGRSDDYLVTWRDRQRPADTVVATLQVCGLTGWCVQEGQP